MKLRLGTYVCDGGAQIRAPQLSEFAYGEALLWSANNAVVYVMLVANPVYDEFAGAMKELAKDLSSQELVSLILSTFGELACDPDERSAPFNCLQPACPQGQSISAWGLDGIEELAEVPNATHDRWRSLSRHEQSAAIVHALRRRHH